MIKKILLSSAICIALSSCGEQPEPGDDAVAVTSPASSETDRVVDPAIEEAGAADEAEADSGAIQAAIPERFHGRWAESVDHCATRGHQVFDIEDGQIGFFESTGYVQNVRADGDYAGATLSEQYGDAPPSQYVFYMALEGPDAMRVRYDEAARFRVIRCP